MNVRAWVAVLGLSVAAAGCGGTPEVCAADSDLTPHPLQPDPRGGFLEAAHAHNDYEHERPLEDALLAGFHSVEADVYFSGGKFEVSHLGWGSKGTLEDLYLKPLQQKVDAQASVLGDGAGFALWLDLKEANEEYPAKLSELLARYPLGRVDAKGAAAADPAVRIVLTGDAKMKEAIAKLGLPNVVRDSNDFAPEDAPAGDGWTHYALDWGKYVGWGGGDEAVPEETGKRLACIVNRAHALGRKVRFYGGPDNRGAWKAQADFGADYIGADDLDGLRSYLQER